MVGFFVGGFYIYEYMINDNELRKYLKFSDILIETGTSSGAGVKRALDVGYSEVRSVELSDRWYRYSLDLYKDDSRVKLYSGRSEDYLATMVSGLERCVVVLDAHPSGPQTAGHDDLMDKGLDSVYHQDNILVKECEILVSVSGNRHLILVDDQVGVNDLLVKVLKRGYEFEYVSGVYMLCRPKWYM